MRETKNITIANFNCTFTTGKESKPMLEHFTDFFYPAITNNLITRKVIHKNNDITQYFLTNIKLMSFDNNLVLVGHHVKRVFLDIRQDFDQNLGFIPIGENRPSAPFSTFMLFLSNHILAYFPDQKGSPDIRSFASTCRDILQQYRNGKYNDLVNNLRKNDFIYDGNQIESEKEFRDIIFNNLWPMPVLNVVPIPSEELVSKKFNELDKIKEVTFKIYNQNSNLDYNPFFNSMRSFMNFSEGNSINATVSSPKNKEIVEDIIKKSGGKSDYKLVGHTKSKEKITIKPDSLSEIIPVQISSSSSIEESTYEVYNSIKNREEINDCSEENLNVYNKEKEKIISFEQIIKTKRK